MKTLNFEKTTLLHTELLAKKSSAGKFREKTLATPEVEIKSRNKRNNRKKKKINSRKPKKNIPDSSESKVPPLKPSKNCLLCFFYPCFFLFAFGFCASCCLRDYKRMSCIPGVTSMKECSKNIQHQSAKKKTCTRSRWPAIQLYTTHTDQKLVRKTCKTTSPYYCQVFPNGFSNNFSTNQTAAEGSTRQRRLRSVDSTGCLQFVMFAGKQQKNIAWNSEDFTVIGSSGEQQRCKVQR